LKSQLGIIEKHEVAETQNAFACLATELCKIENKEIAENQSKLRGAARLKSAMFYSN
jgi:hypothetical protein